MEEIEARGLTAQDLAELVAARRPVVLRRLAASWSVVAAARQGDEALCRYLAVRADARDQTVLVAPPAASGLFFYRDGLEGVNFNRQAVNLRLFLDHLLKLRETETAPALYIQSTLAPEIVPAFAEENSLGFLDVVPRLWIGNRTRVATHFDVADNIAVVAAGRRRFILFPPEQVGNLYVGPLDFTLAGQPVSLADPLQPDYERYPKFREAMATAQTADLEPGDGIYIPSPWWHHVEALSPVNLLVNYWWRDYPTACGTPFTWLIHGLLAVRHLPKPEREAWRAMVEHYVFEDNGDPAGHIPQAARSVLGPMTDDLAAHLRGWLGRQMGSEA